MEGLDLKSAPSSLTEGLRLMLTSHSLDSRSIHAILDQVEGFIGLFERMLEADGIGGRLPVRSRRLAANIVTFCRRWWPSAAGISTGGCRGPSS